MHPTKRGLTPEEYDVKPNVGNDVEPKTPTIVVQNKKPKEATRIVEVLGFDKGYLDVKMDDGKSYRRLGGTLAWRNNNPGNLKFTNFSKQAGAIAAGQGEHSVFPTRQIGADAQKLLLFRPEGTYHNKTLLAAISQYAPSSDGNKPKEYAAYLANKAGVSIDKVLNTFTESQKQALVEAMQVYEGYKEGTIVNLE